MDLDHRAVGLPFFFAGIVAQPQVLQAGVVGIDGCHAAEAVLGVEERVAGLEILLGRQILPEPAVEVLLGLFGESFLRYVLNG